MGTFSVFDLIFSIAVLTAAIFGFAKGLMRQLIGLAGIFVGTYCAYKISSSVTAWWCSNFDVNPEVMKIVVFVTLSIIIYFLALWLARLLDKLIKMAMLSWVNRLFGLLFGMMKIILIFIVLAYAIKALKLTEIEALGKDLQISKTYDYLVSTVDFIFPYISSVKSEILAQIFL
ncbi:MAG: CvpA family protein [Prevotellaceae bacterium]|jgi:membrane protein required for colicin V production|nr:CvpA family protein [Prevotellaceae bacterium]